MAVHTPLIEELDALFRQDPDIDELGVIFTVPPPTKKVKSAETSQRNKTAAEDAADTVDAETMRTATLSVGDDIESSTTTPAPHKEILIESAQQDRREPIEERNNPSIFSEDRGKDEAQGKAAEEPWSEAEADKRNKNQTDETVRDPATETIAEPQFLVQEHKLGVSVHSVHALINEARTAFPGARRGYLSARQFLDNTDDCSLSSDPRDAEGRQNDDGESSTAGRNVAIEDRIQGVEGKRRSADRNPGSADRAQSFHESGLDTVRGERLLVSQTNDRSKEAAERLLSVTRALLLINADHGSAWNARKVLVRDGVHGSVRDEIKLLDLIFTKHAKSPNAWAHRRWCWRNDEGFGRSRGKDWRPLSVQEELKVCQRVADLYPKNYYAWTQRSWVVLRQVGLTGGEEQAPQGGGTQVKDDSRALLEGEIAFVDKWLTGHVSDHSALNHRRNIASALAAGSSGSENQEFIQQERVANSVVIQSYPGHESLWCYRRFLCQAFLVTVGQDLLLPRTRLDNDECSADSGSEYDWLAWNSAVKALYELCVGQDSAQESPGSENEDIDELHGYGKGGQDRDGDQGGWHFEGEIPGAPVGGGMLADFLGGEARFALKCATDKGAWQFRLQRRHALAHLAFVSYSTGRILRRKPDGRIRKGHASDQMGNGPPRFHGSNGYDDPSNSSERTRGNGNAETISGVLGRCMWYCEVTGALKLTFPLEKSETVSSGNAGDDTSGQGRRDGSDACRGVMSGLQELNSFVTVLMVNDVEEKADAGGDSSCKLADVSSGRCRVAVPYVVLP